MMPASVASPCTGRSPGPEGRQAHRCSLNPTPRVTPVPGRAARVPS
jgi:hypothetical protein